MRSFRPVYGIALVMVLVAASALGYYLKKSDFQRVSPGPDGEVHIGVGDLEAGRVRFYHFINSGNQEVRFFVGRDEQGTVQVAFDANEICFKRDRGFELKDDWLVCRVCDKSFRLSEVNDGRGGCAPVPLHHKLEGDELVLTERDILAGWRYFH
jgi:uncharacterized membrane protein